MPKDRDETEDKETVAAARAFVAAKKNPRDRKRVDPAEARRNAAAARDAASDFIGASASASAEDVAELLEGDRPQMTVEAVPPPARPLDSCSGCGQLLGHATLGVCVEGAWACPSCFMRGADRAKFPNARAVNCPTCHRTSVDFTGHNRCVSCGSKGAQPLRAA